MISKYIMMMISIWSRRMIINLYHFTSMIQVHMRMHTCVASRGTKCRSCSISLSAYTDFRNAQHSIFFYFIFSFCVCVNKLILVCRGLAHRDDKSKYYEMRCDAVHLHTSLFRAKSTDRTAILFFVGQRIWLRWRSVNCEVRIRVRLWRVYTQHQTCAS